MTIMQGDSYTIYLNLTQSGDTLTPDLVDDLEVYIGETLRKTFSAGSVFFDAESGIWSIRPTQEETMALEEGSHEVTVRVKYKGQVQADVMGIVIGRIRVQACVSKEVL